MMQVPTVTLQSVITCHFLIGRYDHQKKKTVTMFADIYSLKDTYYMQTSLCFILTN